MADKILYTTPDGNVCIVTPSSKHDIDFVLSKDIPPDAINPRVVPETDVPSDRLFRNAWEDDGGIKVNIPKAKIIAHNIRRKSREEKLRPFDEIIARQIPGNDFAAIEAQRAAIRQNNTSVQTQIDAAQNEAQLKAALSRLD